MLLGAIILTIVGGVWLFTRPVAAPDGPRPTAIVRTTTPTPIPTTAPTPTPEPVRPGELGLGVRVTVNGTGGAGLSIRDEAGTTANRVSVADEGSGLLVVGGPVESEGYTWWLVRDELNSQIEGWAVQDFLSPTN